jgi:sulfonate transport system substrate-binding protein
MESTIARLKSGMALLVLLAVAAGIAGCSRKTASPASIEKVTIAFTKQAISLPLFVAEAKGFFAHEGLQVTMQPYVLGKDAFEATLKGRADFSTVAETPLMFAGLKSERFFIVATIADACEMQITARKSRGIAQPRDLQGKIVGVTNGTTSEYFLQALLTLYRIPADRVRTVNLSQDKMTDALVNGEIDAASAWPPYSLIQEQKLGNDFAVLSDTYIFRVFWNIAAEQEFVKQHPETVKKLLRALLQAQRYILENHADAQKIATEYVGHEESFADYNFDLRLDRGLLRVLEDQARWAINRRLTDRREVPKYLDFVYPDALQAVAPESVSLR